MRAAEAVSPQEVLVREILERIADKWTLLVLDALEDAGDMRFTRLRDRVGGVSQKMLTKTLRQLERDGLVTRRVYPEVPPRVEYRLTPRGESLNAATCAMWKWVDTNMDAVQQSRRAYDESAARVPADPESA